MHVRYDDERLIAGSAEEVWAVVADPVVLASLDDRLTLESMDGEVGRCGSSWAMRCRVGRKMLRVSAVVTAARDGNHLSYDGFIDGRPAGGQVGTLTSVGEQTLLVWSVTNVVGRGTPSFLVRRQGRRELRKWLDSVGREVMRRRELKQSG